MSALEQLSADENLHPVFVAIRCQHELCVAGARLLLANKEKARAELQAARDNNREMREELAAGYVKGAMACMELTNSFLLAAAQYRRLAYEAASKMNRFLPPSTPEQKAEIAKGSLFVCYCC